MNQNRRLVVIETHPIQYHAPLYRMLQQECHIPVTTLYGSDFSVKGYRDAEFGTTFQWDTDLLSGYDAQFLSTLAEGGATSFDTTSARGLAERLNTIHPAAVMLVGYNLPFHRDAFWTAWRGGYPLMFRGETTDHAVQRNAVKRIGRSLALRAFYMRFQALLYVGKHSHDHYEKMGVPPSRLFFSPYCVDTTPFRPQDRKALCVQTRAEFGLQDRIVILFVGKLVPRKAPDLLVQAVKKLPQAQKDNLALLFVGDGELQESLAQLAQELPTTCTVFAGFQNQSQLSRFYHAADVLVLPSRSAETWGLVVNEALSHGVPCVVSDRVGCAPDLITAGETGKVFASEDVNSLAEALSHTLEYCARPEIRAACLRRADAYSMHHAARGIGQAFEKVARAQ